MNLLAHLLFVAVWSQTIELFPDHYPAFYPTTYHYQMASNIRLSRLILELP